MSECGAQRSEGVHPSSALILLYHHIAAGQQLKPGFSVTLPHFAQHLDALEAHGYSVVPLDVLASRKEREGLPRRTVAITFDDGYVDSVWLVARLLHERRLPATFFVVGAALETPYEFWWDTVDRVFVPDTRLPTELLLVASQGLSLRLPTASDEEKAMARVRVNELCYRLGLHERNALVGRLIDWAEVDSEPGVMRPIMARELTRLAEFPELQFGAHSQHHLWLPYQSPEDQWQELAQCKQRLEELLQQPIHCLAYPYGACDAATIVRARRAGYRCAVTVGERAVAADDDALELPRHQVADVDGDEFIARIEALRRAPCLRNDCGFGHRDSS